MLCCRGGRMRLRSVFFSFAHALILVVTALGGATRGQTPPAATGGRGGATAPPPIIWPSPVLPDGPIVLDTAIQHQIVLYVTKGLNQPWSLAFLPDGGILITERPGRLRIVRNGDRKSTRLNSSHSQISYAVFCLK